VIRHLLNKRPSHADDVLASENRTDGGVKMRGKWAIAAALLVLAAAPAASASTGNQQLTRRGAGTPHVRTRPIVSPAPAPLTERSALRLPRSTTGGALRPRVIGGSSAVQGQWGFMVFVLHLDRAGNWDFLCSGTLVSPNVVLTAGHCAVDDITGATLDPGGFGVVTGAVDWTDATDRHISTISQVLVYPSFDPSGPSHDAALLVLSSPVSGPTIPLWGTGSLAAGTPAWIAGWGNTYAGQSDPQTVVQWAPTTVQSTTFCGRPYLAGYPYDASSDLCALNPPSYSTGTCDGDSGGPLLAKDASGNLLEIGLTSVGPAGCDTQTPDYYTAIKPIASWVQTEVAAAAGSGQTPPATGQGSSSTAPAPASPPAMTLSDARSYVRQTLVHLFGRSYRRGHAVKLSCARISAVRVRCGFTFWSGPNDYWGNVTPYYYTAQDGNTYWDAKYKTNRVNDHCYFHTRHRSSCATHPRNGSW